MNSHARRAVGLFTLPVAMGVALAATARCPAQCEPGWQAGDSVAGVDGRVNAAAWWDPDGPGPRGRVLVVGGLFKVAGNVMCSNVAAWDPALAQWSSLGAGTDAEIHALAALPDGTLAAAGRFLNAGGAPARRVARWDGSAWTALGSIGPNVNGPVVYALAILSDGSLVAGGSFESAIGNLVTRWNGTRWTPLGLGITGTQLDRAVRSLLPLPGGGLIAGGKFETADGLPATGIARWDGAHWSAMGTLEKQLPNGDPDFPVVYALAPDDNGAIVAGGDFNYADFQPVGGISRWNGAAWEDWSGGFGGVTTALARTASGDLAASVRLSDGFGGSAWIRHDGEWSQLGSSNSGDPRALAIGPAQDLYLTGQFTDINGVGTARVARWNGDHWDSLGDGTNDGVAVVRRLENGDVVAGGRFARIGGVTANHIALRAASSRAWSPLGEGIDGPVRALTVVPGGDLIAGGTFGRAGTVDAANIASWDGVAWSPLGEGTDGDVNALAVLHDGALVAAGRFTHAGTTGAGSIASWDGSKWSPMGAGFVEWGDDPRGLVLALAVAPNGDLYAAGSFNTAGAQVVLNISRWDGEKWLAMPGISDPIATLAVAANGDVIAGGYFVTAGGLPVANIARWNGAWSAMDGGAGSTVFALTGLPNGDVIAGGFFTSAGGKAVNRIARWDGTEWTPFGPGLNNAALALDHGPDGSLIVGGNFTAAGDHVSAYVADWSESSGVQPEITSSPTGGIGCIQGADLVVAATGTGPLSYQWRRDGQPLTDGANISGANSPHLEVRPASSSDDGSYDCVVSNACGEATSAGAALVICIGDADCNGFVNGDDFDVFMDRFVSGDDAADVDRDGTVDPDDVDTFVAAFVPGC